MFFTHAFSSKLLALLIGVFMLAASHIAQAEFQRLESIAAIVEEDVILQSHLDERVSSIKADLIRAARPIPPEKDIQKQILEQLILESIQLQLAEQAGIRVGDNTLIDTIEKIAQQNGQDLAGFKTMIEEDGLTYKDVRSRIRNDLIMSRLRQKIITNRITITAQDVTNYLQSPEGLEKLSSAYRLGHILLTTKNEAEANTLLTSFKEGASFEEEAVKRNASYDLGWRKLEELPTPFVEPSQALTIGEISTPIKTPSGYHIIKLLDKKGGNHKIVAQTRARHILIKPSEIRDRSDAKHAIVSIREKIINGKDFAEMARTFSEDPVSGDDGGDLGWAIKGDFVPVFDQTMESLAIGEISEPFYSSFGWHIMEVLERRQENIGKEYQLNQARGVLQKKQFEEEIKLWLREIRENAFVEIKIDLDDSIDPEKKLKKNKIKDTNATS